MKYIVLQEMYRGKKLNGYRVLDYDSLKVFDVESDEKTERIIQQLINKGEILWAWDYKVDIHTGISTGMTGELVIGHVNIDDKYYVISVGVEGRVEVTDGVNTKYQVMVFDKIRKRVTQEASNVEWCVKNTRRYNKEDIYKIESKMLRLNEVVNIRNKINIVGGGVTLGVTGEVARIDSKDNIVIPKGIRKISAKRSKIKCRSVYLGDDLEQIEELYIIRCDEMQFGDKLKVIKIMRVTLNNDDYKVVLPSSLRVIGELRLDNIRLVEVPEGVIEIQELVVEGGEVRLKGNPTIKGRGISGGIINLGENIDIESVKANSICVNERYAKGGRNGIVQIILPDKWGLSDYKLVVSKISFDVSHMYGRLTVKVFISNNLMNQKEEIHKILGEKLYKRSGGYMNSTNIQIIEKKTK